MATPGRSSRKNAALLRRKGRCSGNSRVATSSVGGDSEIVCWMKGRATLASAVKVTSMFVNSDACSSATGDTSPAAAPSDLKKRPRCVRGLARFAATGCRSSSSGRKSSIAMFSAGPRPARPLPRPCSELRPPWRVRSSNMLKTSSSSTSFGRALTIGIVAPG